MTRLWVRQGLSEVCVMGRKATRTKSASMRDVALLAGVSVPTVSRYLNKSAFVAEDKKRKISSAIRLLGYTPNPIARALVSQHTRSIAILSSNTTLYGQVQTIAGLEEAAREAGYVVSISVLSASSYPSLRKNLVSSLSQRPAGVVLLNYDKTSSEALSLLGDTQEFPLVSIAGEKEPGVAHVSLQERQGGFEATRYLLSLGHKTVLHVAIPGLSSEYTRLAGWREACEKAGVTMLPPVKASWDPVQARSIGMHIRPDVTAVFAGNDEIAMGVIRGLEDSGRRVPQDVSVVGFDDNPIGRIWNPSITTIHQDFHRAGITAFHLLQKIINRQQSIKKKGQRDHAEDMKPSFTNDDGVEAPVIKLKGKLIVRDSTARQADEI